MAKNLLIVESPAKAKTIEKILGEDFEVKSCYGHIRDLKKEEMGIDVKNNYQPSYIVPEEKEKVFEKFYRLKYSKSGGTGLGLSIAKGFVEAHYGTITLENGSTGGAKFTINIPTEKSYLNDLKNE